MKHYKLNGVDYRASATCAEFKQRVNSEWETSLFDNESELIENGAVLVEPSKAAHSPTPWVANGVKITVANDPTIFERLITEVCGECAGTQDRANAAHIVRCVNAHEELLEALERTSVFALELMDRAAKIDRMLLETKGKPWEIELGEIVRLRQQLGRNRAAIAKATT